MDSPSEKIARQTKNTWRRTVEKEIKTIDLTWGEKEMVALDRICWRQRVAASCSTRSLEQEEEEFTRCKHTRILDSIAPKLSSFKCACFNSRRSTTYTWSLKNHKRHEICWVFDSKVLEMASIYLGTDKPMSRVRKTISLITKLHFEMWFQVLSRDFQM